MTELSPILDLDLFVETTRELSADLPAPSLRATAIQARIGSKVVAFPNNWVSEVLLLPQSQVLSLPFYPATVLGVIHHQGLVVPILLGQMLLQPTHESSQQVTTLPETLTIIRLSQAVSNAAGVGIVIDQLLGQTNDESINQSHGTPNNFVAPAEVVQFNPEMISPQVWHPLRYNAQ
jgi:chemotaxis signal transduction protein